MTVSPSSSPGDASTAGAHRPAIRKAAFAAGAVALALFWLGSSVLPGVSYPPSAVAEIVLRATPGDLATLMIEWLGHWARRLLSTGAAAVGLVVAMQVLVGVSRTRLRPWVAASLLAAGSLAAAGIDPVVEPRLPALGLVVLATAGAYGFVARGVHASLTAEREIDESRRSILRIGYGTALVLAGGSGALGWAARAFGGPNRDVDLIAPSAAAAAPARGDWPQIPGLSPEITSIEDHYVVDIDLVKPTVEAATWRLEISGLLNRPLVLDFESVQSGFEVVEEYSVLTCISNEVGGGLIGNSAWGGVRLKDVLGRAGVQEGAVDVIFRAADGYSDSIPIEVAMEPSTLLAVSQNGEPLTQGHGFPCRVRVPSIYGMKNVKWLESIEVVSSDYQGYWMKRGWSDEAVVKTESRIDVAGDEYSAARGQATWIAGVAWAGKRGVSRVEVSTDGGRTWTEARLKELLSPLSWRHWAYRWIPEEPGDVVVAVRATDGDGRVQTARVEDPHPAGATGYHFVTVAVA